jgi:[ribosomal protein S5]-alanine N-acetyltransferase
MARRLITPSEEFVGERVRLRLVTLADCNERYLAWLNDPEVSKYLETRWSPQTSSSVEAFVQSMIESEHSYLFAIVERASGQHVGNIKLGPIQPHHAYADVSYFIGERASWGRGLASDAIRLIAQIAFERFDLHRVQAGLYEGNIGSARALEKAGFTLEGRLRRQLRVSKANDAWEDHVWYGLLREEWPPRSKRSP